MNTGFPRAPSVRKPLARQRILTLGNDTEGAFGFPNTTPNFPRRPFPDDRKIGSVATIFFIVSGIQYRRVSRSVIGETPPAEPQEPGFR